MTSGALTVAMLAGAAGAAGAAAGAGGAAAGAAGAVGCACACTTCGTAAPPTAISRTAASVAKRIFFNMWSPDRWLFSQKFCQGARLVDDANGTTGIPTRSQTGYWIRTRLSGCGWQVQ